MRLDSAFVISDADLPVLDQLAYTDKLKMLKTCIKHIRSSRVVVKNTFIVG